MVNVVTPSQVVVMSDLGVAPGASGGLVLDTSLPVKPHPHVGKYGWAGPANRNGPATNHNGKCSFLFADGHAEARWICIAGERPSRSGTFQAVAALGIPAFLPNALLAVAGVEQVRTALGYHHGRDRQPRLCSERGVAPRTLPAKALRGVSRVCAPTHRPRLDPRSSKHYSLKSNVIVI